MGSNEVPQSYWQALFAFAARVGSDDPVNQTPSRFHQMSDPDKKWLQEAMKQLVKDTDAVQHMKQQLEILSHIDFHRPTDDDKTKGDDAVETLTNLCDNMDYATDFHKIGGFRLLPMLLSSSYANFRKSAASLIGELAQNHEYCQRELASAGMMPVLLQIIDHDNDPGVKTKAMFALSCLVRGNKEMEKQLIDLDGVSYLMRALHSCPSEDRLQTKVMFLLTYLASQSEFKETLCSMGFVEQLVGVLRHAHEGTPIAEHTLAALVSMCTDCPMAMDECRKPELNLKQVLEFRKKELDVEDDGRLEEERFHANKLLQMCWPKNTEGNPKIDR